MAHLSIWLLLTLLEKSPPSLTVSSSLRFGVLGNKKVLSFLWVFFKRPRKYYLGSSICLSGIGVSELPISSAASWHLVAHPPWVIDTLPLCFVFFFFLSVDCLDPTCSSHGVCVNGECLCSPGWGGLNCELARVQCPDQCSGHGTYVPDTGLCSCDPNWMGPDCSVGKPRDFLLAFPNTHALCSFREPKWVGIYSSHLAWDEGT